MGVEDVSFRKKGEKDEGLRVRFAEKRRRKGRRGDKKGRVKVGLAVAGISRLVVVILELRVDNEKFLLKK